MVPVIDEAQYEHDRGPCLDAARSGTTFEVGDVHTETRWPEFAAAAAEHGIRSSLSVPVVVASDGLGALNFYAGMPSFFDDDARRLAGLFAGQCAVTSQYWSAANASLNLAAALKSRAVIDQAKGVIMATAHCGEDEAFGLLRIQSQQENRKLRDIAAEVVSRQDRRAGQAEKSALDLDRRRSHSEEAEADHER
jgi:GAF domain-containing protein